MRLSSWRWRSRLRAELAGADVAFDARDGMVCMRLATSNGYTGMAEPPSPTTIIETLRSIGFSDASLACQESDNVWRIRARGGLIVYMRKDGQLTVSGKNTHAVRKALGLTSRVKS
jgi:hypothetical protein